MLAIVPREADIDGARRIELNILVPNPVGVMGNAVTGGKDPGGEGESVDGGSEMTIGVNKGFSGGAAVVGGGIGIGGRTGGGSCTTSTSPSEKGAVLRPGGREGDRT